MVLFVAPLAFASLMMLLASPLVRPSWIWSSCPSRLMNCFLQAYKGTGGMNQCPLREEEHRKSPRTGFGWRPGWRWVRWGWSSLGSGEGEASAIRRSGGVRQQWYAPGVLSGAAPERCPFPLLWAWPMTVSWGPDILRVVVGSVRVGVLVRAKCFASEDASR